MPRLTNYEDQQLANSNTSDYQESLSPKLTNYQDQQIANSDGSAYQKQQYARRANESMSDYNQRLTEYQKSQLRSIEGRKKGGKVKAAKSKF